MIYLDTSFILPLFIHETASEKVAEFLKQVPMDELAISLWTKTEFASALARRVRMKEISPEIAETAIMRFAQLLEESCEVFTPSAEDFETATKLLQNFKTGLRAGDALHLAITINQHIDSLYTLDKELAKAAISLNITVKILD